ncbi:MAG: DUF1800 domain-containing protein [Herminiimonas sp.]|nr:DUF1800 domain-containing protein [Herminiimonas sp.]
MSPSGSAAHAGTATAAVITSTLLLDGCGGGGSGSPAPADSSGGTGAGTGSPAPILDVDAARFLAQASMGPNRKQIAQVRSQGYAGWIDAQFATASGTSRYDWLIANGFGAVEFRNSKAGFDAAVWRKLLSGADTLRQRVVLALSEITVVSIDGLTGPWRSLSAAAYFDLLEANAFSNYRTLLGQISTSPAMGAYLTFRGNTKFNPATGALPDENYARELMQLFTIGLQQLNADGTPGLVNGVPQETYTLTDITGLARIFTGWDHDLAGKDTQTPDYVRRPMIQVASKHESGASSFLGTSIPAGVGGEQCLSLALDAIFAHPNVAPFISRQLIQKLVTSNPSAAYVGRVATVFRNDGAGVAGNLKAVIKALLLDDEARRGAAAGSAPAGTFGKLREPVLRLAAWARAFDAASPADTWAIGDTSDPATRLGQSAGRSPSVFNFYRPGYVPPNSSIASNTLVAPEFQIANESSVVGYVNFMQRVVSTGVGDVRADYTSLLLLADDAQALVDEANLVLAAGQLGGDSIALLRSAIAAMPAGTDAARRNRVYAALTLTLAAPAFLVQK